MDQTIQAQNGSETVTTRSPFFRPKTAPEMAAPTVPLTVDLWFHCPRCKQLTYMKEFERNFRVCLKCNHYSRLRWYERIGYLIDNGSFVELNPWLEAEDPLSFKTSTDTYTAKLRDTQLRTAVGDALITGTGTIQGFAVAIAVADFSFLGASMGSVFGEKFVRLIDAALEQGLPLLSVSTSGGARMHEGLFSLMQMAKTTAGLSRLSRAKLPHIAVLVDPCYGGVTASYPMVADVILAEPGAMIGFAGPRVIEQTIRQSLPKGFQTAEFLLEHGMIDQVVERKDLPEVIGRLFRLFGSPTAPAALLEPALEAEV